MWTVAIEGGPRRVNHAAVAIDGYVWTFGGYCSGEPQEKDLPIDIHVLNTYTYRWSVVHARNEGGSAIRKDQRRREPLDGFNRIELMMRGAILGEEELMDVDADDDLAYSSLPRNIPYQRYGHTVCAYNGKAYLWGGRNDEYGASSLLHEFNPRTLEWELISASGTPPPARDGHSAVVYGTKMYIFGGFEEELQKFSQDTYAFDFAKLHWSKLNTRGHPPLWRDFHTAVPIAGKMYVFGGRSDQMGEFHSTKDIYDERLKVLDLQTLEWSEAPSSGTKPCGRRSHSAWVYNDRMYTFGGYQGTLNTHFNDLHCYDPATGAWSKLTPHGTFPSLRRRQCTVCIGSKVYLFGGTMPVGATANNSATGLADLDDLHVLDFSPSLQTLCSLQVIKLNIPKVNFYLPRTLRELFEYMTAPNTISLQTNATRTEFVG